MDKQRSPSKKRSRMQEWEENAKLVLIEGWARDGLSKAQIAKNMGIVAKTLWEWEKKSSKISNAIKKGKEVVDYEVENSLFRKAMSGDVTACIFWLKNRKPAQWRDRKETPEIEIMKRELELKEKKLEIEKAKIEAEALLEVLKNKK